MTASFPQPCAEWADVLTITQSDDLAPSTYAALEAHLAICPACAAVRTDYLRLDRYIQRLPTSRPLPAFPARLLDVDTRQRAQQAATRRLSERSPERLSSLHLIPQQSANTSLSAGRLKSAATIATLLVVVALFAVLLRGFAAGHGGSAPTGSPGKSSLTALPTPGGEWAPIAGLDGQSGLPVIAPSDPRVLYEDLAPQSAPTQVMLRHSDDSGGTWQYMTLPIQVPAAVDDSSLAVSPLTASTVFLTLSLPSAGNAQQCQAGHALVNGSNTFARLSGEAHCSIQFISTDSGQHWSLVQLPLPGAIGAPMFSETGVTSSTDIFRVQGQRLYTALAAGGANIRGVAIGVDGERIVSSSDGGKSWQLADAQLAASGENICNFAPASSGTTLFAITQADPYCYYDSISPNHLWRSDDAGTTWTQVSTLPATARDLMVVSGGGSAQPTVYAQMPIRAQYGVSQPSTPPPALEASTDGGQTWHQAPTDGLPPGTQKNYGPLAVLSDGSIVKVFQKPSMTLSFVAWKAGDATWQQIAPQVDASLAYLLLTSNNGHLTFWAVAQSGDGFYSVLDYDQ